MCVKPLKGICYGINPETGKKKIKVVKDFYVPSDNENIVPIPCGKCIECRLNHAKVWADRMMAEASYHTDNVFLTLTYNDDHLPEPLVRPADHDFDCDAIQAYNIKASYTEGKTLFEYPDLDLPDFVSPVHPLVKRDVQLFMKRLRKALYPSKLKFYACGEYGDLNNRPHYHLILFGCRLDDLKLVYTNASGFRYYTSDIISSCWTDDDGISKGFHYIAEVNWQTCNYVARYVTKKLIHGYDDLPDRLNYPREFSLMSRRPGIGYQWYQDHKDELVFFNESFLSTDDGSKKISMNSYFDHLLEVDDQYLYNLLKVERSDRAAVNDQLSDLGFLQRNNNRLIDLEVKTKNLRLRKGGEIR